MLSATGIVSAATERYALNEGGDIVFSYGFLLYLALILIAVPRRPWRYAPLAAFAAFASMYLSAAFTLEEVHDLGIALYVVAGALAYLATPARFRALTVAAFALWTPALRLFGPRPVVDFDPSSNAVAAVLALLFLTLMLVVRDRADDDERLRRIGLGLLGVACVSRISQRHLVVGTFSGIAPDDLWALVVVAVLPILAIAKIRRPVRDALATGVALGAYVLVAVALILGKGYHVDSVAVAHRGAEIFIHGGNPYSQLDIPAALESFGLDVRLATHYEDGSDVHSYNYPALSFLVPAPFIAAGVQDIRFVYLGEIVLFVLVLVRLVHVPWRPLVAAAVVGNAVIARQNVLAGVDPTWAMLTLFAFLLVARRTLSPVFVGLACAARQPAWFFVPFYVAMVWKRDGRREALRRVGIAAIAGAVPNLPFLLIAPGDFLGGILTPMLGSLESYGVGLIHFSVDGFLPLLPRGAYGALSAVAMVALLAALWRWWRRIPNGAIVFPSLILWFAWRSLQNYFAFAGVLAMAGDEEVLADGDRAADGGATPEDR